MMVLSFLLMAWGEFDIAANVAAGSIAAVCGMIALYTGFALLMNEIWCEDAVPLGKFQDHTAMAPTLARPVNADLSFLQSSSVSSSQP